MWKYLLIMKSFIASQCVSIMKIWTHAYLHTIYIRSEEKVASTKIILKHGWIKETLTFSRCSSPFCLSPFFHYSMSRIAPIIKDVAFSKELYSQQFIYCWRSNPEPRQKLRLMIFPSFWFFKTIAYNIQNNLKEPKYFFL